MNVIRPGWEIEKNLGIMRLIFNNKPGDQYPPKVPSRELPVDARQAEQR
jgi:hypothetical protein